MNDVMSTVAFAVVTDRELVSEHADLASAIAANDADPRPTRVLNMQTGAWETPEKLRAAGAQNPEEVIHHARPSARAVSESTAQSAREAAVPEEAEGTLGECHGAFVNNGPAAASPAPVSASERMRKAWQTRRAKSRAQQAGLVEKERELGIERSSDASVDFDLDDLGGGVDENDVRAVAFEDGPLAIELAVAEELQDDEDEEDLDVLDAVSAAPSNPAATPERLELIRQRHQVYLARQADEARAILEAEDAAGGAP